jgi:hypothetical protein
MHLMCCCCVPLGRYVGMVVDAVTKGAREVGRYRPQTPLSPAAAPHPVAQLLALATLSRAS